MIDSLIYLFIIAKQQRFIEHIDLKERKCNLFVLSVRDDNEILDTAINNEDKIGKLLVVVRAAWRVQSMRRLGRRSKAEHSKRRRPMLVTLPSRGDPDAVLDVAKLFMLAGEACKKIFIKKDVRPSIREDLKRLREAEKT